MFCSGALRSLKNLFLGSSKPSDFNKVTAVYDLILRKIVDSGSPGVQRRQRKVLDTSVTYVRGEENLQGWRPRSDSLILEHQWELEKMTRLQMVEHAKHVLLLREKLREMNRVAELTKLDKQARNLFKQRSLRDPDKERSEVQWLDGDSRSLRRDLSTYSMDSELDRERELVIRCLQVLLGRNVTTRTTSIPQIMAASSTGSDGDAMASSDSMTNMTESQSRIPPRSPTSLTLTVPCLALPRSSSAPDIREQLLQDDATSMHRSITTEPKKSVSTDDLTDLSPAGTRVPLPLRREFDIAEAVYVVTIDEMRASPVVSRRGYLSFLEDGQRGWVKRWVVVRRPYIYFYLSEKDPVERGIINLVTANVEFNEEAQAIVKTRNIFSVKTNTRGFLIQTPDDAEFHDWLYAINPLLAGELRSKLARRKETLNI